MPAAARFENEREQSEKKGDYIMMRREEFLKLHPDIKGDMIAYSSDGEKLGRITSLNQDTINIEKGFFFPRDFAVPYDNIVDVHGNEMIIDQRREALSSWQKEGYEAGYEERGRRSGLHTGELSRGEEIEIPLREEELQAQKISRQKGEVHLRKVVHTEQKTITIPVTTEDVVIEHTPVSETAGLEAGETAFREEEMTIPLMEEDVELVKRQRIKDTVHAKKVAHTEQRELSGEVRVEDIEVQREESPRAESSSESGKTIKLEE